MFLAQEEADQATSLYDFTRLINDEYSYSQKAPVGARHVADSFSDEQVDKYEEHLIRKVSDLIYVSHTDFIKAKNHRQRELRLARRRCEVQS